MHFARFNLYKTPRQIEPWFVKDYAEYIKLGEFLDKNNIIYTIELNTEQANEIKQRNDISTKELLDDKSVDKR